MTEATPEDSGGQEAPGQIETEYEIGQDNIEGSLGPLGFDIRNPSS